MFSSFFPSQVYVSPAIGEDGGYETLSSQRLTVPSYCCWVPPPVKLLPRFHALVVNAMLTSQRPVGRTQRHKEASGGPSDRLLRPNLLSI